MSRRLPPTPALLAGAALLCTLGTSPLVAQVEPMHTTFETSDDRVAHSTWYGAVGGSSGIVLAFHQAGASGEGEYGPIIPRLNQDGWDVVTVDLREGGSRFGGENRTVAQNPGNGDYCAALPDLLGAISYVRWVRPDIPLVLWGSSYSGALAMRATVLRNNDVSAVLAFSPATGDAMEGCRGETVTTADMLAPVLALRPASEMDSDDARAQWSILEEQGHQTYVADPGVHGSSMLVEERVGGDVEGTWAVVEEFLLGVLQ